MAHSSVVAAQPLPIQTDHSLASPVTFIAADASTTRLSVGPSGRQADNESFDATVSAQGLYVAFSSEATNLVAQDSNDAFDVFVRDRKRGVTSRVSLGSGRQQADSHSSDPAISADGRFVAFTSIATNLVAGDTNKAVDVFVRDRLRNVTSRVSVGPNGRQATSTDKEPISYADTAISADGRYVAFTSTATNLVAGDTNRASDIFVHDRRTGVTSRASVTSAERGGNGQSLFPAMSANGRYVAFASYSTNLVAGDSNAAPDVFVRDRRKGTTSRVSVGPKGRQGKGQSSSPAISGDGRYLAYVSTAANLIAGDTNGGSDVFVYDRRKGVTSRVSVGTNGKQARPGSPPNAFFLETSVSRSGRYVAFTSAADNLVPRDSNKVADVFVRDRQAGTTSRVSVGPGSRQADEFSLFPAISSDGRHVAFTSDAPLETGDTNDTADVFTRGPR